MNYLHLLDGRTIQTWLERNPRAVLDTVQTAYEIHWRQHSVCPESLFLRFPNGNRIIALPAYLESAESPAAGLKWISSFPGNLTKGLDRASALVILNDLQTGYPVAVMEGAAISAARTGAFAALAFSKLDSSTSEPRIAVIGCGRISATTLTYMQVFAKPAEVRVFDVAAERAERFLSNISPGEAVLRRAESLEECLKGADVALFATTSSVPYLTNASLVEKCRLLLHVSLRDIGENVLETCFNVTDDRKHVLREQTSLHRLAALRPEAEVVDAELGAVIWGGRSVPNDRTIAFSPFGLGVLDIALAHRILQDSIEDSTTTRVSGFFAEMVAR